MKDETVTSVRWGAVVVAMILAFAGCTGASATPRVVYVTPNPTATPYVAPTEEPTATATPTAAGTEGATASATSAATAAATATATAGASSTAAASFSAAAAAASCTGTADHKAFFDTAASVLSFDVYCAALPSNWWLQDAQYQQPNGGLLTMEYENAGGGLITVGEGNFCPGLPDCWASASSLGSAKFGSLSGSLKLLAGGKYAVYVDAGTTHGYQIIGKGMSQATFVAYAAAMVKIPRA